MSIRDSRSSSSSSSSPPSSTRPIEVAYAGRRVPTARVMLMIRRVGTRLPAYATSMGRVLLGGLEEDELEERLSRIDIRPLTPHTVKDEAGLRESIAAVRRQGYAMVDQELEEGLRSAAVPIRGASGNITAALNVSVHASRASMAVLRREFLPHALEAAAASEDDLRGASRGNALPRRNGK